MSNKSMRFGARADVRQDYPAYSPEEVADLLDRFCNPAVAAEHKRKRDAERARRRLGFRLVEGG